MDYISGLFPEVSLVMAYSLGVMSLFTYYAYDPTYKGVTSVLLFWLMFGPMLLKFWEVF